MNEELTQLLQIQFKHIEDLQNTIKDYQQIIIDLMNKLN
jgi:hypothetical protein